MTLRIRSALKTGLIATAMLGLMSASAFAETLSIWVRASGANAAQHMVDLWNSKNPDKIAVTVIPDNQMVTKLATGVTAGDVPDMISFDLIFMPDFMKADYLVDLTAELAAIRTQAKVAKAFRDLATYNGKLYGTGFTPDVSILLYNKGLFKQAGLDPEKPPTTLAEMQGLRHQDPRPWAGYLWLLFLRLLRRLQHFHRGPHDVGFGHASAARQW